MMSFTCRDMTPERARQYLDSQLGQKKQDAILIHLRDCLTCTRTLSKTMSGPLFDFLTGPGQDQIPSFLREVSGILLQGLQVPDKPSSPSDIEEATCQAAFRQMCHDMEAHFKKAERGELFKQELENIIRSFLGDLVIPVYGSAVNVLQRLLKERMIELVKYSDDATPGEERYRARWEISPEYLINRIWGVSLGRGLNKIFEGGLRWNSETGISILLEGVAGAGKTMLALHTATAFAEQGVPITYYSTSDRMGVFLERLAILGYRITQRPEIQNSWLCSTQTDEFTLHIWDLRGNNTHQHPNSHVTREDGKTLTVYLTRSQRWNNEEWASFHSLASRQHSADGHSCFVIDCLDDLWRDISDVSASACEEMLTLPPNQIGIFVSSDGWLRGSDRKMFRQKFDANIRLMKEERETNVVDHAIEIIHCRTQGFLPGRHYFAIGNAGEEVTIYPSTYARHGILKKQRRQPEAPHIEKWDVGEHFDMNKVVKNDVVRGSAILLHGKRNTHRLPIGLSFLASGLRHNENEHAILLSLNESEQSLISIIKQYPDFSKYLLNELNTSSFNSRVIVGHRPQGVSLHTTPEQILDWFALELARIGKDAEQKGATIGRVLITNMSHLWRSPLFQRDTRFIPTLIKLFKNRNVTALFIDELSEQSKIIGNHFDIILMSDQDNRYPYEETLIGVEKSELCNTGNVPYRIRRMPAKEDGTLSECGDKYVFQLRERRDDPAEELLTRIIQHLINTGLLGEKIDGTTEEYLSRVTQLIKAAFLRYSIDVTVGDHPLGKDNSKQTEPR